MAKIQQVRYDLPQTPAWRQALGAGLQGAIGGASGYFNRQQQQQENIMKMLPVFAQMGMLQPGGNDVNVPGLPSMGIIAQAPNALDQAKTDWYNKRDPITESLLRSYVQAVALSGRKTPEGEVFTPDPAVINHIQQYGNFPSDAVKTTEENKPKGKGFLGFFKSKKKYTVGQIIELNGKKYRVIGGDLNDPDIEEVE